MLWLGITSFWACCRSHDIITPRIIVGVCAHALNKRPGSHKWGQIAGWTIVQMPKKAHIISKKMIVKMTANSPSKQLARQDQGDSEVIDVLLCTIMNVMIVQIIENGRHYQPIASNFCLCWDTHEIETALHCCMQRNGMCSISAISDGYAVKQKLRPDASANNDGLYWHNKLASTVSMVMMTCY